MRILFLSLFIFTLFPLFAQQDAPKSQIILEIDGQEYYLRDGQSLRLEGTFTNPTISVREADTRTFKTEDLQFDYPSHFAYEFEQDFGYRSWTLDGQNFVVMYFEYDEPMDLDFFVDEMVKQFGKQNCKVEAKTIQMGDKLLKGKRINISLIGQRLTLDFMEIELSEFKTHFIAFQDAIQEDGQSTQEGKDTMEMIESTILYHGNP